MITKYDWKVDAKNICFIGDIHGNYGAVLRESNRMVDTVFICCGDCGFGFCKPGFYRSVLDDIEYRLEKKNNWCVMIRGNHDDPAYFSGYPVKNEKYPDAPVWNPADYKRIHMAGIGWEVLNLISGDRTISILCGGGAVSVDRTVRVPGRTWWANEEVDHEDPEIIKAKLNEWCSDRKVYIATHTSPSLAEPRANKGILYGWAMRDKDIVKDCDEEREYMTQVFNAVASSKIKLVGWWYGHFHEKYSGLMKDGGLTCRYIGLDIEEPNIINNAWDDELEDDIIYTIITQSGGTK